MSKTNTLDGYEVIRPNALAELLDCTTVTVWRMQQRGELPKRRKIAGRNVGWLKKDIKEFLDSRPTVGA